MILTQLRLAVNNDANLLTALNLVRALRACDPASEDTADYYTNLIFLGIKKQRDDAIALKNQAIKNQKTLASQKAELVKRRDELIAANLAAENARIKTEQQGESNRIFVEAMKIREFDPVHYARLLEESLKVDSNNLASIRFLHDLLGDFNTVFYKQVFDKHKKSVTSVAITPDGKYVLTGSEDGAAILWENGKTEPIQILRQTHIPVPVGAVAITPDARFMATGSLLTTQLWERGNTDPVQVFEGHGVEIYSVAISSDGRYVLTGSDDRSAYLWERGKTGPIRSFPHQDEVNSVAMSSDGRYLLTCGENVKLWERDKDEPLQIIDTVTTEAWVALTPDGRYIAVGKGKKVALWRQGDPISVQSFNLPENSRVKSVALTPDGRYVVAGSTDRTALVWDAYRPYAAAKVLKGHNSDVNCVATSASADIVVTGGEDGMAKLWSLDEFPRLLPNDRSNYSGEARSADMTPDGRFMLVGYEDGRIELLERSRSEPVDSFKAHAVAVNNVAISSDAKFMLTASNGEQIKLWQRGVTAPVDTFPEYDFNFSDFVVTPDLKFILTYGATTTMKLWERGKTNPVRIFEDQFVTAAALSDDARYILTNDPGAKNAKLWNRENASPPWNLTGHRTEILSVAITPDGRYFSTGSADKILMWKNGEHAPVQEFKGRSRNYTGRKHIWMSPNGRFVLSLETDYLFSESSITLWESGKSEPILSFSRSGGFVFGGLDPAADFIWAVGSVEIAQFATPKKAVNSLLPLSTLAKLDYGLDVSIEEAKKSADWKTKQMAIDYFANKFKKESSPDYIQAMDDLANNCFGAGNRNLVKLESISRLIENYNEKKMQNSDYPELYSFYSRFLNTLYAFFESPDWLRQHSLYELISDSIEVSFEGSKTASINTVIKSHLDHRLNDSLYLSGLSVLELALVIDELSDPRLEVALKEKLRDSIFLSKLDMETLSGILEDYEIEEALPAMMRLAGDTAQWERFKLYELREFEELFDTVPAFRKVYLRKKIHNDLAEINYRISAQLQLQRDMPDSDTLKTELAATYSSLSRTLMLAGRYQEALDSSNKAWELDRDEKTTIRARALALLFNNREAESRTIYIQKMHVAYPAFPPVVPLPHEEDAEEEYANFREAFLYDLYIFEKQVGHTPAVFAKVRQWLKAEEEDDE